VPREEKWGGTISLSSSWGNYGGSLYLFLFPFQTFTFFHICRSGRKWGGSSPVSSSRILSLLFLSPPLSLTLCSAVGGGSLFFVGGGLLGAHAEKPAFFFPLTSQLSLAARERGRPQHSYPPLTEGRARQGARGQRRLHSTSPKPKGARGGGGEGDDTILLRHRGSALHRPRRRASQRGEGEPRSRSSPRERAPVPRSGRKK